MKNACPSSGQASIADGSELNKQSHTLNGDPASRHFSALLAEPRATGTTYVELVQGVKFWKNYRGLSDLALEEVAGLVSGHVSKTLGNARSKTLGPVPFDKMFAALGLQFVLVENPDTAEWIRQQWGKPIRRLRGGTP